MHSKKNRVHPLTQWLRNAARHIDMVEFQQKMMMAKITDLEAQLAALQSRVAAQPEG